MKFRLEQPHFKAHTRDGSAWAIRLDGLQAFRSAWMGGLAFWSGFDVWDRPLDVKLADIVGVSEWTAEAIELAADEESEGKSRELTSA